MSGPKNARRAMLKTVPNRFAKMMKTAARRIGMVAGKLMTKASDAGDIKAVISVE